MDATFWVGPPAEPDSYQLLTPIGGGGPGTGQVWRGVRPLPGVSWQEDVALKVVPALTGADPAAEQAWVGYGNRLMRLNHPGLARVVDVFSGPWMHRQGEQPPSSWARYLVMNLVEGTALSRWLAENPGVPLSTRIAMLAPVAAALDEMHSGRVTQGPLAHGDVKPSNMILRPDGSVVLVDLGSGPRPGSGPATGRDGSVRRTGVARPGRAADARVGRVRVRGRPRAHDHRPATAGGPVRLPRRARAGTDPGRPPGDLPAPASGRRYMAPLAARPEARPHCCRSGWPVPATRSVSSPPNRARTRARAGGTRPKRRHTGAWIALVLAVTRVAGRGLRGRGADQAEVDLRPLQPGRHRERRPCT